MDSDLHKNTVCGTSISLISVIIGGGVVSVPYSYTTVGYEFGVAFQIFVMACMLFSCKLYLETRQRLRCKSSFADIASQCVGDISSLGINFLLAFCIFGILNLYMILFSSIALALFSNPT